MADAEWRAAYLKLLKQMRQMKRQLGRAEAEARIVRDRAAAERKRFHDIRTERRATGRFDQSSADSAFQESRRRKKR